jgi:hypothetical protein
MTIVFFGFWEHASIQIMAQCILAAAITSLITLGLRYLESRVPGNRPQTRN